MPSFVNLDSIQRPSEGAELDPDWGDAVNDDINYLNTQINYIASLPYSSTSGAGQMLVGAAPNVSTAKTLLQGASTVGATDAFGVLRITFPTHFPNGIISVTASNGAAELSANMLLSLYFGGAHAITLSGFSVLASNSINGFGFGSTDIRVNWIALGY